MKVFRVYTHESYFNKNKLKRFIRKHTLWLENSYNYETIVAKTKEEAIDKYKKIRCCPFILWRDEVMEHRICCYEKTGYTLEDLYTELQAC